MGNLRDKYTDEEWDKLEQASTLYSGLGPYNFYYTSTLEKPNDKYSEKIFRELLDKFDEWSLSWIEYNKGVIKEKPLNADEFATLLSEKFDITPK